MIVKVALTALRWLFGDEVLIEFAQRFLVVIVVAIVALVMVLVWSLSIMFQPAGMWWLASQSPNAPRGSLIISPGISFVQPAPGDPIASIPLPAPDPSAPWIDGPTYNQYDPSAYRSPAVYSLWHSAACSAAALAWMLRAYGRPVAALDDSIALLKGSISPDLGLLNHTGTAVASALAGRGLPAWNLHLNSTEELQRHLQHGPLAMDGQKWLGAGHWFVAVGYDSNGVIVRESSGHNVQRLTWAQLYGAVGWSGWAVGVGSPVIPNQALSGTPA